MATTIRPATAADVTQILTFIRALAVYERAPDAVSATEEGLLRDGFGPHPFYECLIAEHDGKPAGFALYFFNYSTWMGQPGMYLEDLFVQPELRGRGIGKALLERVAAVAIEKGCRRLQWEVLDWNAPAIDFYAAMGAEFLDEWRNVRVSGEALARLAESGSSQSAGPPATQPKPAEQEPGAPFVCHPERAEQLCHPERAERVEEPVGAPSFRRASGERVGEHEPHPFAPNAESAP